MTQNSKRPHLHEDVTRQDAFVPEVKYWNHIALRHKEKVLHEYVANWFWPTVGISALHFAVYAIFTNWWVFGYAVLVTVAYRWGERENRWAVTNQRVLARTGVGNKEIKTIERANITDVRAERPFFNPLTRRGKVFIKTAGTGGEEITMFGMDDPDEVMRHLTG